MNWNINFKKYFDYFSPRRDYRRVKKKKKIGWKKFGAPPSLSRFSANVFWSKRSACTALRRCVQNAVEPEYNLHEPLGLLFSQKGLS